MDSEFELQSFRVPDADPPVVIANTHHMSGRQSEPFLRGPVPLAWLTRAANIPRRNSIVVGLVLWHLAGLNSRRTGLVLCSKRCEPFGLGYAAVSRGLRDLEARELIRVDRGPGRCPKVDLVSEPQ